MVIKIEEFLSRIKKKFYLTQYNWLELNITQYKKNLVSLKHSLSEEHITVHLQ
jgi:hypothetical protein